uniref:CC2D2A N-terminal C2 domain-containing protein n=1 Tax=Meloidogyne floridensis TaxID=298350 RepID=A0A915P8Y4_9BILA
METFSTTSQYIWYCEGGVSSFTLSILNNSKSSIPTAAATQEENGEEEEKVKRLEELTSSDKKIEQSIQIGTKYVNTQLHWEKQLEDEITSTTEFTKLKDYQNKRQLLIFTPAIPTTFKNVNKFKNLIKWKSCDEHKFLTTLKNDLESGKVEDDKIQNLMENGKTTASLILKNNLFQQNLNNKIIWRNSVKSDEWLKLSENRLWASKQPTGLWIDLQDLEFDHHWLFTKSESAERELVSAYDAWVEVHQQVLNLIKKCPEENHFRVARCNRASQPEENFWKSPARPFFQPVPCCVLQFIAENCKFVFYVATWVRQGFLRTEEELKLLFNQIVERQTTLERCRAALERAWASADQTRGRFSMERIKGSIFFRSPLFVLSEKEVDEEKQQQEKLPEIERQRRQAVQIFFNNLLVCSSQEHKLEWPSFSVPFGEIISLRVFEKPKQLSILLKEKFGGGGNWQLLAEIFIPLPKILEGEENVVEDDEEIIKNKWMSKTGIQFASTIVRGSYKGSLGCGQRNGLPFTQGRLFCSLKWQGYEDENKRNFQKIIKRRGRTKTTTKSSILYQQSILCPEENLQKDVRLENLRQSGEQQRKLKDLSQFVREEPLPKFSFGLLTSLLNGRQIDLSRRLKPFRGGGEGGNVGVLERGFNQDKKSLNWTKILLNIQSANAVPQRINGEPMQIYLVCSLKVGYRWNTRFGV